MITILIDKNLKKYRERIEFTFNFIFNTIGYSHRIVNNYNELRKKDIVLFYSTFEPTTQELSELNEDRIMFFIPANLELLDGKLSFKKINEMLKEIKLFKKFKLFTQSKELITVNIINNIYFGKFNFDIIGNVLFFLTQSEKNAFERENVNLDYEKSSLFTDYSEFPYVNAILWLMDNFIKEAVNKKECWLVKKENWPANQPFAVSVTHTIDKLQKWTALTLVTSTLEDVKLFFSFKFGHYLRSIFNKIKYVFTDIEPYWKFFTIYEIEKKHKLSSTFFSAAEQDSHKGFFDYRINDKDYILEMKDVKSEHHEIALLCKRNILKEEIEPQKKSLELLVNETVKGIKILNSSLDIKKVNEMERLKVKYDNSIGFNTINGFYNGIAFPYSLFAYDDKDWKSYPIIEFQYCFCDDHLQKKNEIISVDKVKSWIKDITDNLVFTNGHIVLNFSVKGFFELPYLERLMNYMIDNFRKKGAYIDNLENITKWWINRNEVKIEEFSDEIKVFFPVDIEEYTISIVGKAVISEIESAEATFKNNQIHFKKVKSGDMVLIKLVEEIL